MATYHLSSKIISRSNGRSSVGASAYRAGEEIENERDGLTHNYTKKTGVVHTDIIVPEHAPKWAGNRKQLWNEVEKIEKSSRAQLSREVEVALPKELSKESQIQLVTDYAKKNFTDKGMVADIAIHDKLDGNPHAHIMLTMRPFNKDGSWGTKQKKEYILDKNGNKQYDPKKKAYKCKPVKTTDWDKKERLEKWRENWAKECNKQLEREGHKERIDHRSYKEQGIKKVPTRHEGYTVRAMEQRGIETEIGNLNRQIKEQNKMVELIDRQIDIHERSLENERTRTNGTQNRDIGNERSYGESFKGTGEKGRTSGTIEGNETSQRTHEELHGRGNGQIGKSTNKERRRSTEHKIDKSRSTTGNKGNESRDSSGNGFDFEKSREFARKLRQDNIAEYREWEKRNEREQSKDLRPNDQDKSNATGEHEHDRSTRGNEPEKNERANGKEPKRVRPKDIGFSR